jgi:ankyrin repeat protein
MYARSAEAATLLLEHGANLNVQDERGNTALMHAADLGEEEMVAFLVARGADTTIRQQRRPGGKPRNALELAQESLARLGVDDQTATEHASPAIRRHLRCVEILRTAVSVIDRS